MNPARLAAVDAITEQLANAQEMAPVKMPRGKMEPRDYRLAQAIYRAAVGRWLTIDALLDSRLKQRIHSIEPKLRAVLIAGCAQIVFMDKQPTHAVVDESVQIAKKRVRPGAGGLVNAVLRKIAGLIYEVHESGGWEPEQDRIPWGDGFIELSEPVLPVLEPLAEHLAVATSHPEALVKDWIKTYGRDEAIRMLVHSHEKAPLVAYIGNAPGNESSEEPEFVSHESAGYVVWEAGTERLGEFLGEDLHGRWVQDTTAGAAVIGARAEVEKVSCVIDACAGRGTKTRQLAHLYPEAKVVGTDTDAVRFNALFDAFEGWENVDICPHKQMSEYKDEADLVVLDVPCSNLGVLARRLEARYRYSRASLSSLVNLQRQIVDHAAKWLRRDEQGKITGRVLYSTCSVDRRENEDQAAWIAKRLGMKIAKSHGTLPGGAGSSYHDGGYYALLEPKQESP